MDQQSSQKLWMDVAAANSLCLLLLHYNPACWTEKPRTCPHPQSPPSPLVPVNTFCSLFYADLSMRILKTYSLWVFLGSFPGVVSLQSQHFCAGSVFPVFVQQGIQHNWIPRQSEKPIGLMNNRIFIHILFIY